MSDDLISIEVDGQKLYGRQGDMLIEVTDAAGIHIPRFCYHRKLSVAANCRMCLVEVERAPKTLPACATPISEGMRVFTKSPKAIIAQRATMEFLLINHPLDCPVCDQGGECELQDVAMGYGDGVGQYSETKRVVKDKDIGPLVATDMTRCIHCTRCVRFGDEIAGVRELGTTGRSEHMEIGTYVAKAVSSEISGNIIDLCPVGALTAKPSRYTFRPWELVQQAAIAPHDGLGSNMYMHIRNGAVMRVVPRENEAVNEVWLSDRDRFSYLGIEHNERLTSPMIRVEAGWREASWEEALEFAAKGLKAAGADLHTLVAPHATLEELYLAQKLTRGLGSNNVDHRLRQRDFRDQSVLPVMPWLGHDVAELEQRQAVLVIGSHVRHEQPLLAQRLRKAALAGAKISFVNPSAMPQTFAPLANMGVGNDGMVAALVGILAALTPDELSEALAVWVSKADVNDQHQAIAASLKNAKCAGVYLGALALAHPDLALIRQLAQAIAKQAGASLGEFATAGNSAGAWLAGAVPHRLPGGIALDNQGLNAADILSKPSQAKLLIGIEPELDSLQGQNALAVLQQSGFNVVITPFLTEVMRSYAHVVLPMVTFAETSGTYVNTEGLWQGMRAVARPLGEARPAWKILRVLGNLLNLEGFDFMSSEDVRDELRSTCANIQLTSEIATLDVALAHDSTAQGLQRVGGTALYAVDSIVRRSAALQETADAKAAENVRLHPDEIQRLGLVDGGVAVISTDANQVEMSVQADDTLPANCAWIAYGTAASMALGDAMRVQIKGV
ncbi:MAG: NADH-quinone oxidoreductase subunit NuoG [Halothiobacillaceae bacterium]